MQSIYEEVFSLERKEVEKMKQDVIDKYHIASEIFPDAEEEDRQFLQTFSFICLLSFDVYVKKQVIEKLIDGLPKRKPERNTKKKSKPFYAAYSFPFSSSSFSRRRNTISYPSFP